MNNIINMPDNVKMILNKIRKSGHEAVIIGGCVRDSIIGEAPHDWDIATSAQPTEIMEIFKDFRLMTAGLKHGTVTVIIEHEPFEITTYRVDGKYTDFRRPDTVSFTSNLEEDVLRRDFTINAIAYDGEKIIDLHGGVDDIKNHIIRCVGNPEDRFQEDPLRILRAIRFAVRLHFDVEENTKLAMRKYMYLLDKIAIERKLSEFSKIICASGLSILKEYQDIMGYVLPFITDIVEWDRTVDMIDYCSDLPEKLAIIIDMDNVNINSADYIDILLKFSNKVLDSVFCIMDCRKELITGTTENVRFLLSKYAKQDIVRTLNFKFAKTMCCGKYKKIISKIKDTIEKVVSDPETYCYDLKHLNVKGHDLKAIGIPDVEIGDYLHRLLQLVISGVPNDNEILIQIAKFSSF